MAFFPATTVKAPRHWAIVVSVHLTCHEQAFSCFNASDSSEAWLVFITVDVSIRFVANKTSLHYCRCVDASDLSRTRLLFLLSMCRYMGFVAGKTSLHYCRYIGFVASLTFLYHCRCVDTSDLSQVRLPFITVVVSMHQICRELNFSSLLSIWFVANKKCLCIWFVASLTSLYYCRCIGFAARLTFLYYS